MGKYTPLWEHLQKSGKVALCLSFAEIEAITGAPPDHSFLTFKKELLFYSYQVEKISMKKRTVSFRRL